MNIALMIIAATALVQPSGSQLFTLPYGSDPSSVTIQVFEPNEGGMVEGVERFAANRQGDIVLFDLGKPSIRIFSSRGELLSSFDVRFWGSRPGAALLGEDRNVTVAHKNLIERYKPDGTLLWRWDPVQDGLSSGYARPLQIREQFDGTLAIDAGELGLAILRQDGTLDRLDATVGYVNAKGDRATPRKVGRLDTVAVESRRAGGAPSSRTLTVPTGPASALSTLRGSSYLAHLDDNRGFIVRSYTECMYPIEFSIGNRTVRAGIDIAFTRFDSSGAALAQLRIAGSTVFGPSSTISPDGDLISLVYDTDCVHVVKFPLSQATSGFVAMHYLPTLRFDGVSHVALGALAEAESIPLKWDQATKTVTLAGAKIKTTDPGVRMIEGRMWVDAETAMAAGLNARWDKTGTLAYVQTQ